MKTMLLIATFTVAGLAQSIESAASQVDHAQRLDALGQKATRMKQRSRLEAAQQAAANAVPNPYSNVLVSQITHEPITWTLEPKGCSLIKFPMTGKGDYKNTLTVLQNEDGTYNYEILGESSGVAVDTKGNAYIFVYKLPQFIAQGNAFPAAFTPFTFTGPDTFQLIPVGPGGTAAYSVNIFFNLRINSDGSFKDLGTIADNDPNCDPI